MRITTCLLTLVCIISSYAATAGLKDSIDIKWPTYSLDEKITVAFPRIPVLDDSTLGRSYKLNDSFISLEAFVYNMSDELARMKDAKPSDIETRVYETCLTKIRAQTTRPMEIKKCPVDKVMGLLVTWYPLSAAEWKRNNRIKPAPAVRLGPGVGEISFPPWVQQDHMLFYGNRLYVFSIRFRSSLYYNDYYFEMGGLTSKEVYTFKNKFFHSIAINKKKSRR